MYLYVTAGTPGASLRRLTAAPHCGASLRRLTAAPHLPRYVSYALG